MVCVCVSSLLHSQSLVHPFKRYRSQLLCKRGQGIDRLLDWSYLHLDYLGIAAACALFLSILSLPLPLLFGLVFNQLLLRRWLLFPQAHGSILPPGDSSRFRITEFQKTVVKAWWFFIEDNNPPAIQPANRILALAKPAAHPLTHSLIRACLTPPRTCLACSSGRMSTHP